MNDLPIIAYDGDYKIVYSESFNLYDSKLKIIFFDREFLFNFEKDEPKKEQKDINAIWNSNILNITLTKKFRNSLGVGTTEKMKILQEDENFMYFAVSGRVVGENILNIIITFYVK